MNRYKILSWTALVISIALLILPRIIPICTGQIAQGGGALAPMQCHYAYQAEFIITLLAVILSVALFALRTGEARLLTSFFILLLGIIIILLPQPWVIGICQQGGACLKTTFFATIGGGLLTLNGALIALLVWKSRQEEGK